MKYYGGFDMYLKEYLLNLRNKLKQTQKIDLSEEKTNCVYPNSDEELNTILTDTINNFFPVTGQWSSSCFNRPNEILQSNLRNNKLLAKMVQRQANLPNEYYNKVLLFINSSDLFKQKVHEYEQTIVKWQINFIKNGGEGWICDDKLGGDCSLMMPYCDIAFRKGVVDTLTAMGMDKEAIEEGLEKNSDMWRNQFIDSAFKSKYDPIMFNFLGNEEFESLPKVDLEN